MKGLRELGLSDRDLVCRFLGMAQHSLSAYSFPGIYIWKALYSVQWRIIDGCLCVFFRDPGACFLYLPPLGEKAMSGEALRGAFEIMDRVNANPAVSRIENVEEPDARRLDGLGFPARQSGEEYLYERAKLASLAGNSFKSKRASVNYCAKHYRCVYTRYEPVYEQQCRTVFDLWKHDRVGRNAEKVYAGMIDDTERCLEIVWKQWRELCMAGRVVAVDGRVCAFTFGYELEPGTFCVAYEIARPGYRGMSQYIFWMLCREFEGYSYINAMDDSGLANLKAVKKSYRPSARVLSYTVTRTNGGFPG